MKPLRISEKDGYTILQGNRVVEPRDIINIINDYLIRPCTQCSHPRFEHFTLAGEPIYCCDGCNGYMDTNKEADKQLASAVEELDALRDFVRSLNSLAFEEWHGHYQGEHFDIFDGEDNCVATGSDALEAWRNLTKPTDGGIFGPRGLCLNK